ncbi:MAG: glycosyltransferase [Candidatus Omnitrophica bacterium]|nr:glycosyltransferase [Patescibacteria group bacterium]MBU1811352.1 glycosyltransferase [Candidatus Omnitrophota bacterium]
MKILVVGDGHSKIHEAPVVEAFRKLGHQVGVFYWAEYFRSGNIINCYWLRAQNKFIWGPRITKINRDLLASALSFWPDLIFIYRGTHVMPSTIIGLKAKIPHCKVFSYNNDDPFTSGYSFWLWQHFIAGISEYDLVLAYRHHNLEDFRRRGAKRVKLLRSWFVSDLNHPVDLSRQDKERYECDVVFIGHYEPDLRVALLESIVRRGWRLKLFGPGYDWDPVIRKSSELKNQIPVQLVWGEEYNRALCGARIALCFLSKLNRDTYTRRCFEIPATKTFMLSEYTDDLATLFQEGKEVEFFRSEEEMLLKIERYLKDEPGRKRMAEAGFRRVYDDGHDVVSRMLQVLKCFEEIKGELA